MLFKNSKKTNVLTSLLDVLNVKYTRFYANKLFNEHPNKYNMLGISQMLTKYGINNGGTVIEDKEKDLCNIETPFVAHSGSDFMLVRKVSEKKVDYTWNGLSIKIPTKKFIDSWSGAILLVEPNEASKEPNYLENRKIEILYLLKFLLLIFILCGLLIKLILQHELIADPEFFISLIINIIGVFIGYLFIQKQSLKHSKYADKICSLFKKGDCNDILESKASKFMGIMGWSEIGFSYFVSNILVLLFLPHLILYVNIINICALPYSFWSIWYQKWKAKQWCPLCLIVMGLLWVLFISNLVLGKISIPTINFNDLLNIAGIYSISLLLINLLISKLSEAGKIEQITQEISSLKANASVFIPLLKLQPYFNIERATSNILLGNPSGNILVTILTNPHCNPCANMHTRIEKILEQNEQLCVQYIFSSFEESLDISNKFLIAAYLNTTLKKTYEIYNQWFDKGKFNKEDFFRKYNFDLESEMVKKDFEKHNQWRMETKLTITPTVLVFGHKLPENFKVEDLIYFKNLDVNTK